MQKGLSKTSCRDGINAIIVEGGKKVPAAVRQGEGVPAHDGGTRRHWVIAWLRGDCDAPDFSRLSEYVSILVSLERAVAQ